MSAQSAAETPEMIRDGAVAVLLAEGLPHLSYDRIAQEAGVSRQLVRYHYPTPDDLMLAICEQLAAAYRETLIRCVAQKAGPERLSVFFDFYFDLLDGVAKPRDDQVYDALFSLATRSQPVQSTLREQYRLLGTVLSHEIRQAHLALPIESCEEIAYLMITLMYGHWKMVATLGMSEENNRVARRALDRILSSYLEDPAPQAGVSVFKAR